MSENGLSGKRAAHLDSHQECSFHELKLSLFTTSYPSISSAGFFFFFLNLVIKISPLFISLNI